MNDPFAEAKKKAAEAAIAVRANREAAMKKAEKDQGVKRFPYPSPHLTFENFLICENSYFCEHS